MSTLIAWTGVDQRGPASLYLASDSKFTINSVNPWLFGRKIFTFQQSPDVIGYCGDVLYTSHVLAQLIEIADRGCLFPSEDPREKFKIIREYIETSFRTYPISAKRDFEIVYGSRILEGMKTSFFVGEITFRSNFFNSREIDVPTKSNLIGSWGSGGAVAKDHIQKWQQSDISETSRGIFSGLCDALASGKDSMTGGAPQLVALYRHKNARVVGVVHDKQRYILGMPVMGSDLLGSVEWRNNLFEICDHKTMDLKDGAQRHARPRGI